MPRPTATSHLSRLARAATLLAALCLLGGCTVITIAGVATSAAIGAVQLTGAAVGAAVDLVIPDGDDEKK